MSKLNAHYSFVMSNRGRPAVDREWNSILSRAANILPHEDLDNAQLIEDWRQTGELPHGCKLRPGHQDRADEKVWLCAMYVGGKQRVIGSGSLHQCARLYDAALFRFEKFRLHPAGDSYNFTKEQAKVDNTLEAGVISYLTDLENLLIARGELVSALDRKSISDLKNIEGKHGRTALGRLEQTQFVMIEQIESLKMGLQSISEAIRQSNLTLAAINSRLALTPIPAIREDKKVVPSIPLIPACFTVAPIGVNQP